MSDRRRELGVEFGEFKEELDGASYPITNEELLEMYGDATLATPNGIVTLAEVLEPLDRESYDDSEEIQRTVFNVIGDGAIGRKFYSDRDPPALGEERPGDSVSF